MAKLGEATKQRSFESYPVIKTTDLVGVAFTLAGARGPYHSAELESDFIVVTVILPSDAPKSLLKDGDVRSLFMGYVENSQRTDLLEFFEAEPDEVIGPVMLRSRAIGQNRSFWEFYDPEEEAEATE